MGETTMRLLIVDDEPAVLRCLERVLRSQYEVTTVERADAALILLAKRHFDAILVDVDMPGMRGDEFKRRLPSTLGAKVVMMSGGAAGGVGDVLAKPLDLGHLMGVLDELAA
jgi:DNA-binding response OmpR family regulator